MTCVRQSINKEQKTHNIAYPTRMDISGAMLIVIIKVPETSLSFKAVFDIVPTEKSFAQNIIDRLSIADKDPNDTSCGVVFRSTSKPFVEISSNKMD